MVASCLCPRLVQTELTSEPVVGARGLGAILDHATEASTGLRSCLLQPLLERWANFATGIQDPQWVMVTSSVASPRRSIAPPDRK